MALVEDERHKRFVRRYLERKGFNISRQVYFAPMPNGRGCGEQAVRENYTRHVRAYRSDSNRENSALIVAIDADVGSVENRLHQLELALQAEREPARTRADRIVLLIPRRNIETWILCLTGSSVNEESDYKRSTDVDQRIKPAARMLFDWSRENALIPERCIPSIHTAIAEVRRLG